MRNMRCLSARPLLSYACPLLPSHGGSRPRRSTLIDANKRASVRRVAVHAAPATAKALTRELGLCTTAAEVLTLYNSSSDVDAIALSAGLVRLSKLPPPLSYEAAAQHQDTVAHAAVSMLATLTPPLLSLCTAREVATMLQAVVKLRASGSGVPFAAIQPLLEHLTHSAHDLLAPAAPRSLATIAWSLAKLEPPISVKSITLLGAALHTACNAAMPAFTAQDIALTAWALSTWSPAARPPLLHQTLLAAAATRAVSVLRDFTPQGLCLVVYALAHAPALDCAAQRSARFLDTAAQRLAYLMPQADGRSVAMAVWAYATLQHSAAVLFSAAAARALHLRMGAAFDDQALANLLWSFSTAGHSAPQLFQAAAAAIPSRAQKLVPQHIATLALSLARAVPPVTDKPALAALATAAAASAAAMTPQELASTALAFATAQHYDPAMMEALAAAALPFLQRSAPASGLHPARSFSPQMLSNLLWAFARLDFPDAQLITLVSDVTMRCAAQTACAMPSPPGVDTFAPADVAQLAWAFTLLQSTSSPQVLTALLAAANALPVERFTSAGLCQLFQIHLLGAAPAAPVQSSTVSPALATSSLQGPPPLASSTESQTQMTPLLLAACRAAWLAQVPLTHASKIEAQVCAAMTAMQLVPHREQVSANEYFSVDIAVEYQGVWLGVEVDGPSHFAANVPGRLMGEALLRRRCLMAMCSSNTAINMPARRNALQGMVYVDYEAWHSHAEAAGKQSFLLNLLNVAHVK